MSLFSQPEVAIGAGHLEHVSLGVHASSGLDPAQVVPYLFAIGAAAMVGSVGLELWRNPPPAHYNTLKLPAELALMWLLLPWTGLYLGMLPALKSQSRLMLGIPFNLASYALLLVILAKSTGFEPGVVSGFLSDVHIYENHLDGAREQLSREPRPLPKLDLEPIARFDEWTWENYTLTGYDPHPSIKFPIAV